MGETRQEDHMFEASLAYIVRLGRKEGRKEGREGGRKEGRKKGRKEERKEGRKEQSSFHLYQRLPICQEIWDLRTIY
jgi:predicted transposase YdaD